MTGREGVRLRGVRPRLRNRRVAGPERIRSPGAGAVQGFPRFRRGSSGYMALASDGDGTLTRGKRLAHATVAALERWRASGRRLILVTGETEKQLAEFAHLHLF